MVSGEQTSITGRKRMLLNTILSCSGRRLTRRIFDREKNGKIATSSYFALDFNPAVMVLNNPVAHRKTKTGPLAYRFGCKERIKNLRQVLTANPGAII